MSKFFKQKNKISEMGGGFTLVETLVALSIFSLSILSIMTLLSGGISSTDYVKQKLTASYLAQEGIEYARNMRDTFMLYDTNGSQAGWNAFVAKVSPCSASIGCYFGDLSSSDYTSNAQPMAGISVTACGGTCPTLLYDSATGKYNYATGTNSGLIRRIRITQINADELSVSTRVFWTQGSGTYALIFSEVLYNWAQTDTTSTLTDVTWTSAVGATVSGNSLSKTGGTNLVWDAGAISNETIAAGNGYVEFTATETNKYRMAGLGNGNTDQNYTDIQFAIYLLGDGNVNVRESGTSRGAFGTYAASDVFRVAVESGQVRYYKNGTLLYTSLVAPTYPLLFDTSLYDTGGTITNAKINDY